jgi:hypothetical protein
MRLLLLLLFLSLNVYAEEFRLESSVMNFSRNEIAIPGDSGGLFNTAKGDWKQHNGFNYRMYYTHQLDKKNKLRFLYAPLQTSFSGSFDGVTNFNGETFAPGSAKVDYTFNSYRVAYHKEFYNNNNLVMNYGVVGKVRDAEIKVTQGNKTKSRKDLGFVPLLHFDSRYIFNEINSILLDIDGLVAPQGRAIDLGLFLERKILNRSKVFIGYRFLEGGADNDKVKTFSFVNFYSVGFLTEF